MVKEWIRAAMFSALRQPENLDRRMILPAALDRADAPLGAESNRQIMTSPFRCFAHQHMPATVYAVYDVSRALASANRGTLYFSGPKIAKKFLSMGQNTPYKAAQFLSDKGWFKLIRKSGRRADGTLAPTLYRVLDHEEWTAEHPGCCMDPSEDWQTTLSPSHPGEDHHTLGDHHHILSDNHHILSEQTYKEQLIQTTYTNTDACSQPLPQNVMASIHRDCDGATAAPAHLTGGEPLPQNVMEKLPPGSAFRDGEWYTGTGVKIHPNVLESVFRTEKTK